MTEISFYHLSSSPVEKTLPKLLEKVYTSGKHALVKTTTEERLLQLDTLLWTYSRKVFLAHGRDGDDHPTDQPIYLTTGEDNPNEATIALSVDGAEITPILSYDRYLILFDGNAPDQLQAARQKWVHYTKEGHTLTYWQQDEEKGWVKKTG